MSIILTRMALMVVRSLITGKLRFIESKFGPSAKLTDNQTHGYPSISAKGGVVRGENGVPAGLRPGTKVEPTEVLVDWWR